jgi:hypothetical protein
MVQSGAVTHQEEMVGNEKGKTVEIKMILDSTVFWDVTPCSPIVLPPSSNSNIFNASNKQDTTLLSALPSRSKLS